MATNYAPAHNGHLYHTPQYLLLFQQINLASCAARRAQENVQDSERFGREYDTARMWARKSVVV
jgi:hypothetical protein